MTNYFRIQAPYPALTSTLLLSSPQIGNNTGLLSNVVIVRMEDGGRRSFIRRGGGKKRHQWNFILSHDKMEEFQDFMTRYRGATFKVVWRDRTIIGKININPIELRGEGRAGGWPGDEAYGVTLELVETE